MDHIDLRFQCSKVRIIVQNLWYTHIHIWMDGMIGWIMYIMDVCIYGWMVGEGAGTWWGTLIPRPVR